MLSHEPFWDDEFVLLVHPQFAIYDIGQGQYTDVYYGAEPVTATIPVASLDACARGIPSPYQGQDPCSASYSDTTLIAPATGIVYRGSANTVELTAAEAGSLLKLDPFYEGGQGVDLAPTRALEIQQEPYGSYYGFGEKPYTVMHTYTNTQVSTTTTGQQTVSSSGVTDVVGNDFNAGFSFGLGQEGVNANEGLTLDNSDKVTTDSMVSTTFSDSTAVSQQAVDDGHGDAQRRRQHDPGHHVRLRRNATAPSPGARQRSCSWTESSVASCSRTRAPPVRRRAPPAVICSRSATPRLLRCSLRMRSRLDQAREQFSDVLPTSRDDAAIAFLVADRAMNTYGKAFRPSSPLTQGALATQMGEVARVPASYGIGRLSRREVRAGT